MDILDAIKTRRSIRKFTDEPVCPEVLKEIVELASYAPSWKNSQTPGYVIVQDREILDRIAEHGMSGFDHNTKILQGANTLVVVTSVANVCGYNTDGTFTTKKEDKWEMFDAGIASQTFMLAAHEKGIGTVLFGIFDEDYIAEQIGLEEGRHISALIVAGHPAEAPQLRKRKSVDELVRFL